MTTVSNIYYSLVYPHLIYCSALWGGAFKTLLDSLFICQKKIICIMFHKKRFDHTNPLFREHKLLKLQDIISLQTLLFVYRSLNVYPMDTGFQLASHAIHTRQTNHLTLPLCRTSHAQQNVIVRGSKLWNSLSSELRSVTSQPTFKSKIKQNLLQNY